MSRPAGRSATALLPITSVMLTAGFFLSRLPLLTTRRFDGDEFEHAHVAWSVLQGQVPYRDFFEHHTLFFHYLLAGLFSFFEPERSADHAFSALFAARHATWALSGGILLTTLVIARRFGDAATGWVAMPLAAANIVLALRAIEIRPDGLATLLWLWSLLALHAALARLSPAARQTRLLFALAGALIAVAVLTSQKLLMAGPWLAGLLAWYVVSRRFGGTMRQRIGDLAWHAAAVLAVWGLAILFFAANGAAAAFLRLTFLEGVRWSAETTAATTLAFVTRYDPWLFALTAGGAVTMLGELLRNPDRKPPNTLLLVPAAGMFAGLFVIPVPYPQYCLTFVPLFSVIAAAFLIQITRAISAYRRISRSETRWAAAGGGVCAVAAAFSLTSSRPEVFVPMLYPAVIGVGVVVAGLLAFKGRSELALAALLLLLSIVPAQAMRWMSTLGDRGQFADLRYVLDQTRPDAVVLDGWTGYGVFRPHASYYWMLHPGVQAMLSPAEVNSFVDSLITRRVHPDIVLLDEHLERLSPVLTRYVETEYSRVGAGPVFRAR